MIQPVISFVHSSVHVNRKPSGFTNSVKEKRSQKKLSGEKNITGIGKEAIPHSAH